MVVLRSRPNHFSRISAPRIRTASLTRRLSDAAIVVAAASLDLLAAVESGSLRTGGAVPAALAAMIIVATYALLLLRWRYPARIFALHWMLPVAWALVLTCPAPVTGLYVAAHALARTVSPRFSLPAAITGIIPMAAAAYERHDALAVLVVGLATAYGLGLRGLLAAEAAQRRVDEADRDAADLAERAVRAERLRLARDLHDIVSHSVSAMLLQAAGAKAVADHSDERVLSALTSIERTGVQAMRELHRLLGLLREDDAATVDVESSSLRYLDSLVKSTRRTGLAVHLRVDGDPIDLDPSVDLAAYRVVQECLSNVMKHGGSAAEATIDLSWQPDSLRVRVRSVSGFVDGEAPPVPSGFGLRGLRERVELLGGDLETGEIPGGYLTSATLPVHVTAGRAG
jgi:signal transduction histidine kinase